MKLSRQLLLTSLICSGASVTAQASETIYFMQDSSGQTLLTNVNKPTGNFKTFNHQVRKQTYSYNNPKQKTRTYTTKARNRAYYGSAGKYGYSSHSNSRNRNAYDSLIKASARRHGVDPALVKAIIHTESAFNPNARSHVGAQGLMQLMPGTARDLRVYNPWNPAQNIDGGTKYIASLLRQFNNNVELALAGYNAGPNRQSLREGRIPNIKETRNYVKKVLSRYHSLYKNDPSLMASSAQSASARASNFKKASFSGNSNIGTSKRYSQSAYEALR